MRIIDARGIRLADGADVSKLQASDVSTKCASCSVARTLLSPERDYFSIVILKFALCLQKEQYYLRQSEQAQY